MGKLLLRVAEAEELLGLRRQQIYLLIARGVLPALRLGPRSIRIPLQGLQRWIEQQTASESHGA